MKLLLAFGQDPMQWLMLGVAGVAIAFIIFRPRLSKKRDPLESGPRFTPAQQRVVEREMETLLVELSNMARQIAAQLDTRARELELLIDEADAKLAALDRAARPHAGGFPPLAHADAPPAQSAIGMIAPASPTPALDAATEDARHAEVYRLLDGGADAQAIAQQLSRPRGEIELIIALRPRVA